MGTEETKSTTATANNTTENNVTTTQKVAYGEEKIKSDEEEEGSSREKKPAHVSTTTRDPKIEEEKNVIVVANNQQPPVPPLTREDNDEIKIQTYSEPPPLTKKEDGSESLSMKAHQAEESVLDAVDAVGVKVGSFAKKKFGELDKSLNPSHMSAVHDSRKIEALGPMVEELARVFEDTTTMIRKVPYEEQVDLLTGYKKLLEEQIKVIDSRINMSKRLK
ncbi:MAG: hypothetical protein M3M86_04005 [Thermoproteota archaeon]|nr:hypothetical protein [Thermoproteota archaeon]